ncbi:MAG: TMEM43 family protein [Hyphomicrobiaceae bacterium]|nr:TMEM43 family protein [Hyphomicrobiaceae bacterium]
MDETPYVETTSTSWFQRLQQSVAGVGMGIVLLLGMVWLLWWNEGRAVQTARSLAEGSGAVVSVAANTVTPGNQGKLVHVSGPVAVEGTRTDPVFGISTQGIALERRVEMYQWVEHTETSKRKTLGGGEETVTTYTYRLEWRDRPVDSGRFKRPGGHSNPQMVYRGERFVAPRGTLGAFELDRGLLSRIGGAEPFRVPAEVEQRLAGMAGVRQPAKVLDGGIFLGANPQSPSVGDYRITFSAVPVGPVSVVARQTGKSFAGYQTKAGDVLFMVRRGEVPASQMFADAVKANNFITWIVRAVGLIGLFVAFSMVLGVFGVVADVIPFLGSIVRMGTGFAAFILAVAVGTVTIGLAWLYFRPLIGIAILAIGVGVTVWGAMRGRQAAPAPARV